MKKNMTKSMLQDGFARKLQFTLLLLALILPLELKVLIDTPAGVAAYMCNSYAGIYPTATTMGLLFTQILTVAADMVRAGLIGCVLCALLYAVASGMDKTRMTIALTTALLSPIAVAGAGIGLNYLYEHPTPYAVAPFIKCGFGYRLYDTNSHNIFFGDVKLGIGAHYYLSEDVTLNFGIDAYYMFNDYIYKFKNTFTFQPYVGVGFNF